MGVHEDALRNVMCRIEEVPFDSDRKLMSTNIISTVFHDPGIKGAVDVLDRCVNVRYSDGIRPMTEEERKDPSGEPEIFGKRTSWLAFAYKESEEAGGHGMRLYLLGLISMVDPPRSESVKAVAEAAQAGIKRLLRSLQ